LTPVEPTHAEASEQIMSTAQTDADAKLMADQATTGEQPEVTQPSPTSLPKSSYSTFRP
jgi:hypothetical protein